MFLRVRSVENPPTDAPGISIHGFTLRSQFLRESINRCPDSVYDDDGGMLLGGTGVSLGRILPSVVVVELDLLHEGLGFGV